MKEEKDILNNLKRTDKQSVPEGFFDSFSDNLMSKINDDSFLELLPKNEKPEVPNGFFDSFSDEVIKSLDVTPVKKTKIISLRVIMAVASVAAVFAFVVFTTKQNTNPVVVETVFEELTDDDFDEYLAYLDETTIVDFIIENDLNIEDVSDVDESIYDEIESELDGYYYGL